MKKIYLSILLLLSFTVVTSHAKLLEIRCPETIETKQHLSSELVSNWDSFDDKVNARKHLEHMGLFEGDPNEGARLAPNNKDSNEAPYWVRSGPETLWAVCFYRQTTIRLKKEIPSTSKKCTLKYKSKDLKEIHSLICS